MLKIKDVSFLVNDKTILENISFNIEKGQHTSLSGPSGSGKSTILKIIASLQPFTSGNVYFKEKELNSFDYRDYRKEVSYCYQSPQLFGETVKDNLVFPSQVRGDTFNQTVARDLLNNLQLDYITFDKKINSLSGGEKQRVALARNLMYPPKVLLLDEITAGLDNDTSSIIWTWLFQMATDHDITLVWISHNKDEQEMAFQKIFIEDGKIVAKEDQ